MTWFLRSMYPATGLADDSDELWREFQRLRQHITGTDQNNWRQNGIARSRIVKPANAHNGPSDVTTAGAAFPFTFVNPLGLINSRADHDGIWRNTTGIDLSVTARMEGPWIVAACAQFSVVYNPPAPAYSHGEIRVAAASNGPGQSIGTALLNDAGIKDGSALCLTTLLLPAGPSTIQMQHRVTWDAVSPSGNVTLFAASMWAFGLYR